MRKLLYAFYLFGSVIGMVAQTEHTDPVLVFRNTGEVNLFYSDRLDSISLSRFDADSVEHEEFVSQVFHSADTTMFVPIQEIDSVAFGNRNEVVMKENVTVITEEEFAWIIRYDGENIYYLHDTPDYILPSSGDKLFYGKMDDIFPFGLVAQVNSVTLDSGEYVVNVSDVELADVFDRLFYAGPISGLQPETMKKQARAPIVDNTLSLDIIHKENLEIGGEDCFSVDGNVVAQPLRGYYYFDADISNELSFIMKAKIEEEAKYEETKRIIDIPLGVYALVFTPSVKIDNFVELSAEISAEMDMKRTANIHVNYVKSLGKEAKVTVTEASGDDKGNLAGMELTCDGELYMGLMTTMDFNIVKERGGVRLKAKFGPSFHSEFGIGLLQSLEREYNPEAYGKAKLDACMKVESQATAYYKKFLFGEEEETELWKDEFRFLESKIDLFPRFFQTRAIQKVQSVQNKAQKISVSTKNNTELLADLETGFELETPDGLVLDTVTVDTLMAGTENVQGFSADMDVPKTVYEAEKLFVRPVFKYVGYKIKAEPVQVICNPYIQPMLFSMSNGCVTILSGYPFNGEAQKDSTLFIAGPYISVNITDTVFHERKPIITGVYIDGVTAGCLLGTWHGTEGGQKISYTFYETGEGEYTLEGISYKFRYELNLPHSGQISIYADNGEFVKILQFINLTTDNLQYKVLGNNNEGELFKVSI